MAKQRSWLPSLRGAKNGLPNTLHDYATGGGFGPELPVVVHNRELDRLGLAVTVETNAMRSESVPSLAKNADSPAIITCPGIAMFATVATSEPNRKHVRFTNCVACGTRPLASRAKSSKLTARPTIAEYCSAIKSSSQAL